MRDDPWAEAERFEPDPRPQRKGRAPKKTTPRDHQLAEQIFRVLSFVLPSLDDEALTGLYPSSVVPWPDASKFLVRVSPSDPTAEIDVPKVLDRLQRHKGFLRSEIASEIHRKRTPELTFEVGVDASE